MTNIASAFLVQIRNSKSMWVDLSSNSLPVDLWGNQTSWLSNYPFTVQPFWCSYFLTIFFPHTKKKGDNLFHTEPFGSEWSRAIWEVPSLVCCIQVQSGHCHLPDNESRENKSRSSFTLLFSLLINLTMLGSNSFQHHFVCAFHCGKNVQYNIINSRQYII